MTIESAIVDLTLQTTTLLDTCVVLRDSTSALIANAVTVSENATIIPMIVLAKNLIDMQTLLVTIISTR